ncbi:MAG: hypothetical protein ACXVBX_16200 [Flavisolibacter sp.]
MNPGRTPVLIAVIVTIVLGCKKSDESKKFSIKINDSTWTMPETSVKSIYFAKFQHLFIDASDGREWFRLGTNINTASPLTSYKFEPNGNNAAAIQLENVPGYFITDNNVADVGGSFSLTSFDTAQKRLSCNFLLNCYNGDRLNKKTLSSTLSDLPFSIDTLSNVGNLMSCTINGVKTINWETSQWGSLLNCGSTRLDLEFHSMASFRALRFYIPFSIGTGTYPIYPYTAPYNNCNQNYITAKYDIDSTYYPTSGTISITTLDAVQRKMEANFSLNVKDSRGDRIQFTNGSFKLNTWRDR